MKTDGPANLAHRVYVPAAPGQVCYQVFPYDDLDHRTELDDIHVETLLIVAWRISLMDYQGHVEEREKGETAYPVTTDHLSEDWPIWHPLPDGSLIAEFESPEKNLADVKAKVLKEDQRTWDLRQKLAQKEPAK